MEEKAKTEKNSENTETKTTVSVEVSIHEKRERRELRETKTEDGENKKAEMVPVSQSENDFTIKFDLTADKVKNFLNIVGEGVGDYVKEKISGNNK